MPDNLEMSKFEGKNTLEFMDAVKAWKNAKLCKKLVSSV